jgi:hypothetical protein
LSNPVTFSFPTVVLLLKQWGWAILPNAEFVGIYLYACTATKSVTQLQDAPFVASMVYLPQNFECKV